MLLCLRMGLFGPSLIGIRVFPALAGAAVNTAPPASPVKLIFIHHSTGQAWLDDGHGGLGLALHDNNYFVSDTNYGWGILGKLDKGDLDQRMDQINRFEAMLVNEGALVLKFWFHLTKDGQRKRLKELEKNPKTAWRVTKWNWDRLKTYDQLQDVAGHVLRMTNTPWAPWIVVEGTDDRYRSLTVGKIVLYVGQP